MAEWRPTRSTDLRAVARRQRWLLLDVLLMLLGYGLLFVLIVVPRSAVPDPVYGTLAFAGLALPVVTKLVGSVLFVMLAGSLGVGMVARLFMALWLFVPFVAIVLVAMLNGRATKGLKSEGIRVGFLGVPGSEYHRLAPGVCRGCGHDVSATPESGPCPECGRRGTPDRGGVRRRKRPTAAPGTGTGTGAAGADADPTA